MPARILILQGNPDPRGNRYGHALAQAYQAGARQAGHDVRTIDIAKLTFPLLTCTDDYQRLPIAPDIADAQESVRWASHIVLLYPLWLGTMPAIVKGFLEQLFRPGFAYDESDVDKPWSSRLKGRSVRIVVTMGMPGWAYRWFYFAHSLRSLKRNVFRFCGMGPVRHTLVGSVETMSDTARAAWLSRLRAMGHQAK